MAAFGKRPYFGIGNSVRKNKWCGQEFRRTNSRLQLRLETSSFGSLELEVEFRKTELPHLGTRTVSRKFVVSSQNVLIGSNPVVWFCDRKLTMTFTKNAMPESRKLRRWYTYINQFRLNILHIPGVKNELEDYISRNNFGDRLGVESERLALEAFAKIDNQPDLNMFFPEALE